MMLLSRHSALGSGLGRRASPRPRALIARSSGASDGAQAQVKLSVNKHVEFGETLALVGNLQELGTWSPSAAPTLTWGEGDNWTAQLSLPTG